MAIGKKGIFFTLAAIMFVFILMVFIKIEHMPKMSEKIGVTNYRVGTMDSFVTSVEEDIERALYITSFRTLVVMTDVTIQELVPFSDVDAIFEEVLFHGTINGEPNMLIEGETFYDWNESVYNEGLKLNIIASLDDNPTLEVYQDDPWSVKTKLGVAIKYSDVNGFASWERDAVIIAKINLTGFIDPSYNLKFGSTLLTVPIIETPYEDDYTTFVDDYYDVRNLRDHLGIDRGENGEHSYYRHNIYAPDYLMRLKGNLQGTSDYGIESLINYDKVRQQLPEEGYEFVSGRSIVDYEYWKGTSGAEIAGVLNPPITQWWFMIDIYHKGAYGLP